MEFIPVDLSRHLDLCIAFRKDAYEVSFGHQDGFDIQEITSWFQSIVNDNEAGFMIIREFREQDAPILWALFYNTIRNINLRDYTEQQVKAWAPDEFDAQLWLKKMTAIQPFVAELDVDHFFCHHEYQGQGVGRALMTHVIKQAEAKGLDRIYSEVSITARPFYEHM